MCSRHLLCATPQKNNRTFVDEVALSQETQSATLSHKSKMSLGIPFNYMSTQEPKGSTFFQFFLDEVDWPDQSPAASVKKERTETLVSSIESSSGYSRENKVILLSRWLQLYLQIS